MGTDYARKRDEIESARLARVGQAWLGVGAKMESANPATGRWFKSFSVRYDARGDEPYRQSYFVIVRASLGGQDLVKFRQVSNLLNLGHVILDMLRTDKDWRQDKYGSD